ncbi:MAG TPA: class I SAM-dependent methyltransferase [Candidatus Eisenbacteria bacterium]|jgi:predicted O-methyltransferase YrrM
MNPVLAELLRTGTSPTPEGGSVPLQSHVLADEAEFLSRVVRELSPVTTLEVGLAMGCSALAICDAVGATSGARHIVMDPRQNARPLWGGIGLSNLARAGFAPRIEFHEQPSHRALARLEAEGRRIQFAFIDGFHTFDYTLVDFFLVDRLLEPGGAVAFDDADWPSVRRVVRYVATNLAYTVHAAMPPRRERWSAARRVYEGVRGVAGATLGAAEKLPGVGRAVRAAFTPEWRGIDARLGLGGPCVVLRKTAEDSRRYDHHVDF